MTVPAAHALAEITSQPEIWLQAIRFGQDNADRLPTRGSRVAVVGCGTSYFVSQVYAAAREAAGHGPTDAFVASEFPAGRRGGVYDLIVAITRSGTTTEVLDLLSCLPADQPTLTIVGDPTSPGASAGTHNLVIDFADEQSVVQTRFATSAVVLLRTGLGEDLTGSAAEAAVALADEIPDELLEFEQYVFLGHGPDVGLAHEAALKMRESALAWAESYPAFDYRHGPIALAEKRTLVWIFGTAPDGLEDQIRATGATVRSSPGDPLVDLVRAQRLAIAVALHRGLDPDRPRHLSRSIILR